MPAVFAQAVEIKQRRETSKPMISGCDEACSSLPCHPQSLPTAIKLFEKMKKGGVGLLSTWSSRKGSALARATTSASTRNAAMLEESSKREIERA